MTDTITIKFTRQQVFYFILGWLFEHNKGWSLCADDLWLIALKINVTQVQSHIFDGVEINDQFTPLTAQCAQETAEIFGRKPPKVEIPPLTEPLPIIDGDAVPQAIDQWCPTFNRISKE